jgi:hypothetical protein
MTAYGTARQFARAADRYEGSLPSSDAERRELAIEAREQEIWGDDKLRAEYVERAATSARWVCVRDDQGNRVMVQPEAVWGAYVRALAEKEVGQA